ncbi:N-acetylglucosamine-6-phosphate deacetylase [Corticicoccus populi]|uniref:N-acetylglucosamine-6-phosphate deacetylase n=1 Tax=Corticicoccus populi TaxID=1812821 RepID=A0ABW5X009_9STAP
MQLLIKNVNIVTHEQILWDHWLLIEDSKIKAIGSGAHPESDRTIDGENHFMLPGAVDQHIHGAFGVDAMDADENYIHKISSHLPSTGVTSFLATTMTAPLENVEKALKNLQDYRYESGAEMLGIHQEGPFISKKHPGAQDPAHISPLDHTKLKALQEISGNKIRLMTYAPEEDKDGRFLKEMNALNIIPSAGHTDATFEELTHAHQNGMQNITHLYNGMRGLHHREPGVVGFSYLGDANVEIIADGIHSLPVMVNLAYKNITSDRMILITDAMRAQGLPDGVYDLGGQDVHVKGNEARLASGSLAGSVLTMDQAVKNMFEFTDCGWIDIVKMTAYNTVKTLGIAAEKGVIKEGADADLVLYNDQHMLMKTFIRGEEVYSK